MGADVFANACGPCRHPGGAEKKEKNSIVHSFNRNFAERRNQHPRLRGLPVVTALAGDLTFNPMTDTLPGANGPVKLPEPMGYELPEKGFDVEDAGYLAPAEDGSGVQVVVKDDSERLQLLTPFEPWDGENLTGMRLLIKAAGKCTTDHISMAGPGSAPVHLDNIANNAYRRGHAAGHQRGGQRDGSTGEVPAVARAYKAAGVPTLVVGDSNYEGSSREHAAMQPRHLGVPWCW